MTSPRASKALRRQATSRRPRAACREEGSKISGSLAWMCCAMVLFSSCPVRGSRQELTVPHFQPQQGPQGVGVIVSALNVLGDQGTESVGLEVIPGACLRGEQE